jgi:hypothetical protein
MQQLVTSMSSAMTRVEWSMQRWARRQRRPAPSMDVIRSHRTATVASLINGCTSRAGPHIHTNDHPHPYDYNGTHPDLSRIFQVDDARRTAL